MKITLRKKYHPLKKNLGIMEYSILTWQYSGVSAQKILYSERLKKQDSEVCQRILEPSQTRESLDDEIVSLLHNILYPFREAALMIGTEHAMQQVISSRRAVRESLQKRGWDQIEHPLYSVYLDFLAQEKINYDTLAEASRRKEDIDSAIKIHNEFKSHLEFLHARGFNSLPAPLQELFFLKDTVLERYCTIPELVGRMLDPDLDLKYGNIAIEDPRERIENTRRNLQRRILNFTEYNQDVEVANHIKNLMRTYIEENIRNLRILDYMMTKNVPYIMRDYHDWILNGECGILENEDFHLNQFLRYTALAHNISKACGTPDTGLLPSKILPKTKSESDGALTDIWKRYVIQNEDKPLHQLREDLINTLRRETLYPVSIRNIPEVLWFNIKNPRMKL
jgi:hypothetical protein